MKPSLLTIGNEIKGLGGRMSTRYGVSMTSTLVDGLKVIRQSMPHAILVYDEIPDVGFETAIRIVRLFPGGNLTKIIVLGGRNLLQDYKTALDAGADLYFALSTNDETLLSTLDAYLLPEKITSANAA